MIYQGGTFDLTSFHEIGYGAYKFCLAVGGFTFFFFFSPSSSRKTKAERKEKLYTPFAKALYPSFFFFRHRFLRPFLD